MSKDAFSRLPRELTKLFDDYYTRVAQMLSASDMVLEADSDTTGMITNWYTELVKQGFSFGEKVFLAMVFNYMSKNSFQLTPGFARMLKVLTRNTHREIYVGTEWEGGPEGHCKVSKIYPETWNRFVKLAHRFYELEDFNGRIRHVNPNLILHMSLCVECGSAILTEENNKSFICSGACRVSFSRSQKGKGAANPLPLKGSHQKPEVRRIFTELSKTLAENMALTLLKECQIENKTISKKCGIPEDVSENPESALEWLDNFEMFEITEKRVPKAKGNVAPGEKGFDIKVKTKASSVIPNFKDRVNMLGDIKKIVKQLDELYKLNPLAVLTDVATDLRQQLRKLDPTNPMAHLNYSDDVPRYRWLTDKSSQIRRLDMHNGDVIHPRFKKMKDYAGFRGSRFCPELDPPLKKGEEPSDLLKYLVSRADGVDWREFNDMGEKLDTEQEFQNAVLKYLRLQFLEGIENKREATKKAQEMFEFERSVRKTEDKPDIQIRLNKSAVTIDELARKLPLLADPENEKLGETVLKSLAKNVQLMVGTKKPIKAKKPTRGKRIDLRDATVWVTTYEELWKDDPDKVEKTVEWLKDRVIIWQAQNFEKDLNERLAEIGNLPESEL